MGELDSLLTLLCDCRDEHFVVVGSVSFTRRHPGSPKQTCPVLTDVRSTAGLNSREHYDEKNSEEMNRLSEVHKESTFCAMWIRQERINCGNDIKSYA